MWKTSFIILILYLKNAHFHHAPVNIIPFPVDDNENAIPLPKQGALGTQTRQETLAIGTCKIVIDRLCPDPDVTFFLFTQKHPDQAMPVRVGSDAKVSNLSKTDFNPKMPTKIIIHGYNSNMFLNVLVEVRKEYLKTKHNYNIFMVDWSPLANGPCYPAAVWNTRHVGTCTSQLVQRIREMGAKDIHLIGFSLGAQLTNFVANALSPYKVSRITGLDPAGPGFITSGPGNKLDKNDAIFVDVLHTNALVQGIVEESGHVDFYLNGGVIQPGCWAEHRFFACNHHRAPLYFAESINTKMGFWGWPCASYGEYLFGRCPPKEPQIVMGDHVDKTSSGVHLVITDSVVPFAVGKFTGPSIEILLKSEQHRLHILNKYKREILEIVDVDELIESLYHDGTFNVSGIPEGDVENFFENFHGSIDSFV